MNFVVKRNNSVVGFDITKIEAALLKAINNTHNSVYLINSICEIANDVKLYLEELGYSDTKMPHIEDIQNAVEHILHSKNLHHIADSYSSYRNLRAKIRQQEVPYSLEVIDATGNKKTVGLDYLYSIVKPLIKDLPHIQLDALILNYTHNYEL